MPSTPSSAPDAIRIPVPAIDTEVSGLWLAPPEARAVYVLAHGAGAGMHHRFLTDIATLLAGRAIATLRFQFPYTERGGRHPDRAPRLETTVRAAVAVARCRAPRLPLVAGGKSMGGRITSQALAERREDGVRGLILLGFPLHPPGKAGTERADHLRDVQVPILFLQGDRDKLADLGLLSPICDALKPPATLHVIRGGDHSFDVLQRSGRTRDEALAEIVNVIEPWITQVVSA